MDGAELHGADSVGNIAISGDDHDRRVDFRLAHLLEQIEAIHLRHAHVQNGEVEGVVRKFRQRLDRGVSLAHGQTLRLQSNTITEPDVRLVIDDEDSFVHIVVPLAIAGRSK